MYTFFAVFLINFWESLDTISYRGMPSLILSFVTRFRRVVSLTPRSLYPLGKRLQCQLNRGLSGPETHSGRFGEKKNILLLQGIWTPDHPARSLSLYRL